MKTTFLFSLLTGLLLLSCSDQEADNMKFDNSITDTLTDLNNDSFKKINFKTNDIDSTYIEKTVFTIDSLLNENALTKYDFPNMSVCGGALDGYYYDDVLVKIQARYGAETGVKYSTCYLYDTTFYKSRIFENFTVNKAEPIYKEDGSIDYSKTEYVGKEYLIYHTTEPIIQQFKNGEQIFSHIDRINSIYDNQVACFISMYNELKTEFKPENISAGQK